MKNQKVPKRSHVEQKKRKHLDKAAIFSRIPKRAQIAAKVEIADLHANIACHHKKAIKNNQPLNRNNSKQEKQARLRNRKPRDEKHLKKNKHIC